MKFQSDWNKKRMDMNDFFFCQLDKGVSENDILIKSI